MRTISAGSLAQLAQNLGTEPVNIIEVEWVAGGPRIAYADDEDLALQLRGRIMEISGLDDVQQLEGGGAAAELSIVLDDTDGSIKAIMDVNDVHKCKVYVYQWFKGLALNEKFLLFQGQLNSPFTWKESDRTISFSVVSKLEDKEVGFSPEEGQFPSIPLNLIGKPWPSVFGQVNDIPGVQISEQTIGTLATGTGIADFTIPMQALLIGSQGTFIFELAIFHTLAAGVAAFSGDEEAEQALEQQAAQEFVQAAGLFEQRAQLVAVFAQQVATQTPTIRIINGRKFPQGTSIVLFIEGAYFEGHFEGDIFHIAKREHPEAVNFGISDYDKDEDNIVNKRFPAFVDSIAGTSASGDSFFVPGSQIEGDSAGFFWADAGARVIIAGNEPQDYVASIVPGTVLKVAAFQTVEGTRRLTTIPANRYSVSTRNYGTINAVIVTVDKPMSTYEGEGWDDDIYISFKSDIGPNTVNELEYLISLYTDLSTDTASFNTVRTQIQAYPSNFAILDRRNIIDLLQDIAMQARCAIWVSDDTFYLRYLAVEPSTVAATITESDIQNQTLEISHTPTEDLVTKLTASWRDSYAAEEPNRIILRHNVKKYGIQEREIDWFIYNNQELVLKSATFWLIRWSNTWKKVRFSAFIKNLAIESLDAVLFDFAISYVANQDIKAIVEKAVYNSGTKLIDIETWTPVKAGTMVPYDFAWPAAVDQALLFPTLEEEAAGFAGGDGPGKGAIGNIQGFNVPGAAEIEADNDLLDRGYSDKGDPFPSDIGDVAPDPPGGLANAPIDTGRPQGVETPPYVQSGIDQNDPDSNVINLRKTKVFDPKTMDKATLDSFFEEVTGGRCIMKTTAQMSDGSNQAEFNFKFDDETGKYGAGTAFLED